MLNFKKTTFLVFACSMLFPLAHAAPALSQTQKTDNKLPKLPTVPRLRAFPAPKFTDTKPHLNQSARFNYNTINNVLWPIVDRYTAFPAIPKWYANTAQPPLPIPKHTRFLGKLLTLRDAIWIALRNNPDVKNDEVQRILDKFALAVARYNFEPHFTDNVQVTKNLRKGQTNSTGSVETTGSVSINNPFGGSITTSYTNDSKAYFDHRNTYTTTVKQSLMNGGWLTSWNTYLDAINTEKSARLTFKSNIMTIVTGVITDYTSLVSAYNTLMIQKRNFKTTKEQLNQDQLKFRLGRISRSELLQEQATYQTNKLSIVTDENSVQQSYQTFLTELGLVPTARIRIDQKIDISGFRVPDLATCINTALRYNTTYIDDKYTIEDDKRALTNAINGLMPTVDLTGTFGYGNGTSTSQQLVLNLSVPIDDMDARQTELQAKIALEKDKIALAAERQSIVSQVTSQWKTVQADLSQISLAEDQIKLQDQVVQDSHLSLQYGRSSMFDYLQERDTLLQNQVSLVGNKITYITDVASLDQLMGVTLRRWNIKLRY